MSDRAARLLPWLLVTALLVAATALHARDAFAAGDAEETLRAAVEARGERYAGDCATTVSPRDLGMLCSRLAEERDGRRAYLVGRTFSEFSRWLFLERAGDGWRLTGEQPLSLETDTGEVPWP